MIPTSEEKMEERWWLEPPFICTACAEVGSNEHFDVHAVIREAEKRERGRILVLICRIQAQLPIAGDSRGLIYQLIDSLSNDL